MKKKITALLCSVLVLVSVFALTCAAKPNDVDNYIEDSIYQVESLESGGIAYLMTWKTFSEQNYMRYYNCLSTEQAVKQSQYLSDFTPNFVAMKVVDSTVNGTATLKYIFEHTFYNDGGEYDYQQALHDNARTQFHTVRYIVTFYNDDVENPLYIGDVSLVKTPILKENSKIQEVYGFQFDKLRWWNYSIDVEFYDYEESENYPLPISLHYDGRFHTDTLENVIQYNYDIGHLDGYNQGYTDGCLSMEKWDFYSLISALFTAPIDFINAAFSFELFGINLAPFIKTLITGVLMGALLVFILKLVSSSK